jgi:multidrug efflux pump subunit AcrA (membrane-fusion protein)
VRLRARDAVLRPGMTATVNVPVASERQALRVPVEALSAGADATRGAVYVLDHARHPQRIPVQVGVTDGRMVEVRGPALQAGASVILDHRAD